MMWSLGHFLKPIKKKQLMHSIVFMKESIDKVFWEYVSESLFSPGGSISEFQRQIMELGAAAGSAEMAEHLSYAYYHEIIDDGSEPYMEKALEWNCIEAYLKNAPWRQSVWDSDFEPIVKAKIESHIELWIDLHPEVTKEYQEGYYVPRKRR
ncbi:hypothetical protein P4B35_08725 [Pontiellaceae bacterium B12227]|nr:hypothetical protein [Pontiellaceae bacterium B12227]